MELTHGGLFEGIGGFSEGARRAGVETLWFSENNNYKQNILKQHFPEAHLYGSIFKIKNPPYVDIITGGFPCTDISAAGGRTGIFGDSSSLYTEMYRVAAKRLAPVHRF